LSEANYKIPKKVIIRDQIPLTRIGKADRDLLRKEVIASMGK
jgi:acyl-CoA synthetase (AMP-forming)/AMP-acid ligase II